jgi:hypothetical protein
VFTEYYLLKIRLVQEADNVDGKAVVCVVLDVFDDLVGICLTPVTSRTGCIPHTTKVATVKVSAYEQLADVFDAGEELCTNRQSSYIHQRSTHQHRWCSRLSLWLAWRARPGIDHLVAMG